MRRSERGATLVELAISMPLLIIIIIGVVDFGRVFYYAMQLTNAARAGAQFATQSNSYTDAAVIAKASAASPQISPYTVNAPLRSCFCEDNSGTSTLMATCTSTCASPNHVVVFVTVTASKTFSTVMNWPGFPTTVNMSRGATMRSQ